MEPDPGESTGLRTIRAGDVARWTLDRPARRNVLSRAVLGELEAAIDAAEEAPPRVVVLAATGPVFSAGHDLAELAAMTDGERLDLFETCSRVMMALGRLPAPVIARVHGLATAAGCQLAAACDLIVAAEEAAFAAPGVKIGLFCATPMVPLARALPRKVALEMLLTGQPISARRACELGMVNRVVPAAQLDAEVDSLVSALLAVSPSALAHGKRAFHRLESMPEADAYVHASRLIAEQAGEPDAREGMAAFLEKRPPDWPSLHER